LIISRPQTALEVRHLRERRLAVFFHLLVFPHSPFTRLGDPSVLIRYSSLLACILSQMLATPHRRRGSIFSSASADQCVELRVEIFQQLIAIQVLICD